MATHLANSRYRGSDGPPTVRYRSWLRRLLTTSYNVKSHLACRLHLEGQSLNARYGLQGITLREVMEMVRNKKGFTLIELLIVVVIIGILAAIAIPKFAGTKSKAYIASMKSDLKNMVLAQESYFTEYNTYSTTVGDANFVLLWTPSTGVVPVMGGASATTFNATATHAGAPGTTCGVYVGSGAAPGGAPAGMNEGEVECW